MICAEKGDVPLGNDPAKFQSRSIRSKGFDYRKNSVYFVSISTYQRACLFGKISDGILHHSTIGQIVYEEWLQIGKRDRVELDAFIIMPNHIHGIVVLESEGEVERTESGLGQPHTQSLNRVIGAFKASVTRRVNSARGKSSTPIWTRNYHEQVIRNERTYSQIRQYVENNPALWTLDDLYQEE